MFKQLFATMNEVLDGILHEYPTANESKKEQLDQQIVVLKSMSHTCIEEWLLFEEKMESITGGTEHSSLTSPIPIMAFQLPDVDVWAEKSDTFLKGEGYYQLFMFDNAIPQFEKVVEQQPDFLLARLYLAMSYLRNGHTAEASRHFQLLISLTEHAKMKAISYNAMGCIQVHHKNLEKANEYFKLAYSLDPSIVEPIMEMGSKPFLMFDKGFIH